MKKRTKSIVSLTACILILTAGVGAIGTATKGFKDWKVDNWGQNFKDIISKDKTDEEKGKTEQVASLSVDKTASSSTYIMPSKSVNFGNSLMSDDEEGVAEKEVTVQSFNGMSTQSVSRGVDKISTYSASSPLTYPQSINLKANVTPSESEKDLDLIKWEVSWVGDEDISQYIELTNSTSLNVTVSVKKAFSKTATLKVTVGKNGLNVSDSCSIEFYKQLTGITLSIPEDSGLSDGILSEGETIAYEVSEQYSTGTIDQLDNTETKITFTSNLTEYKINYDFTKNFTSTFDYGVFYNSNSNFTNVDVLTGAGRNKMNSVLKTNSKEMQINAIKGIYSKSIQFDVAPETVVYPESVTIGDGGNIEIGKN